MSAAELRTTPWSSGLELLDLPRSHLAKLLCSGHPIEPGALADTDYRGLSLGLPAFVDRLTWKKFKKVFRRDRDTGGLHGWNVRLEQNALDGPCIAKRSRGEPVTFGHYEVRPLGGYRIPLPCRHGLMLDYSTDRNGRVDPLRCVRDPIVALDPGSTRLLLGWSYLDLGVARVGTPSFFVLEREA
jgi:hypothetical protein